MKSKPTIDEALGLPPISGEIVPSNETSTKEVRTLNASADEDYEFSRQNIVSIIETGTDSLESLVSIAEAGDHPAAYDSMARMINALVGANKQLVEMSKDRAEKKKEVDTKTGEVTNNNVYVGSTKDLQDLMREIRENKK